MEKVGKEKNNYEISLLLKNKEDISLVDDLLSQYGAEILYHGLSAETHLAYPIKKQNLAHFSFIQFSALPEIVEKISASLKLSPAVLRMLIITPPIMRSERVSRGFEESRSPRGSKAAVSAEPAPAATHKGGALTNEALEERLEEILK